ncbi:ABC transporter substrate-binding protein [Halorarius halobius]|uniref:ABC transporter substrate-binding protein n=1 Tax=Halorarius halobius TaxID=2962671 RepID=UPI0020CEAE50|nr:ABC transporter substrate-binding protein [Halorarius halobius]
MRRRTFIAGTAAGAAMLAGCTGDSDTPTPTDGGGTPTSTADQSYSVEMAPVGEVTLESVPESVAHYFPGYADMAVALGHGDSINSVGLPSRYHTDAYAELDGVSVDTSSMTELVGDSGIDKEVFLELDSDLHMIDPKWLTNNAFFGLEESDVEQLSEAVAPFLGNTIFRRTDTWHDYRYYSMYEAFEKVAEAYQERERFEAFREFHDAVIADVQTDLPPATERPNGLLCFAADDEPEAFSPYRISGKGTNKKQFHDLGITDALAGSGVEGLSESNRGKIDYETMLEVDPDSILVRGHESKSREEFQDTVVAFMENHDTASQLRAVEAGNVFRGGPIYEGPVQNLFLTERYATLYFPEQFSGDLFDREELAGIITG